MPRNTEMLRDLLKYEVTEELGFIDRIKEGGWKVLTSREIGMIGAQVRNRIKKILEEDEKKESETSTEN